jgi:hypothetical protein
MATAEVGPAPCLIAKAAIVAVATVGRAFTYSGEFACLPSQDAFSDPAIEWGDGSESPGVAPDSHDANLGVTGQHVYDASGEFPVTASVTDEQSGNVYTAAFGPESTLVEPSQPLGGPPRLGVPMPHIGSTAVARDPSARHGRSWRGIVALVSFNEQRPPKLRATIDWGDGSSGPGTIAGTGGSLSLLGRHRWRHAGTYPVTVRLLDHRGYVVASTLDRVSVR